MSAQVLSFPGGNACRQESSSWQHCCSMDPSAGEAGQQQGHKQCRICSKSMLLTWREDALAIASRTECLPLIECGPPLHSPSKLPGNHFSIVDKIVHKLRGGVAAILVLQACQSAVFYTYRTLCSSLTCWWLRPGFRVHARR